MSSKVIVITGASGGIGAELAKILGKEGHILVLAARREKELKQVLAAAGGKGLALVCDVRHRQEVRTLMDRALMEYGRVDVWVNNAGRGVHSSVQELTEEDFDEMMAVNVKSALYGMQAVLPHFKQGDDGHIINVASFLGRVPLVPIRSAYNAAKAALISLCSNLRMELKKTHPGIRVSTVMPGVVTTDFGKNALNAPAGMPSWKAPVSQTAGEVAEMIAQLISQPQAELYTQPGQKDAVVKYYSDVEAFENNLGG
jgi:NAD(P)-dependent dehydrogenase (short-subunit alcohol dehydrogenase family)